jgi:hypothetical protein
MPIFSKGGPIEVWLSQKNLEVTCTLVREDESTTDFDVESISLRGAQREITGWLIDEGYQPAGRWTAEVEPAYDGTVSEVMRRFVPAKVATS